MSSNAWKAKTHNRKARSFNAVSQVQANIYFPTSYKQDYVKATPIITGEAWISKLYAPWFAITSSSSLIMELFSMVILREIHSLSLWNTLRKD